MGAVCAAQKDIQPIMEKIQASSANELPPAIKADLEAAARKYGFKDFNDYDEVTSNITMTRGGPDSLRWFWSMT